MVRRREEWVSKLSSVDMYCCDSKVIKWCSSEADMNICLSGENPVCISTTPSVTGWSNGVASLEQSITHVAFELWNDLYFRIKPTPRIFESFVVRLFWTIENFPITFNAKGPLLLLTTRKAEVNACCNSYGWLWPTEVGRRQLRACLFIRLKTDTFGHALLQHILLQVWAQVVYLL